MNLNKTGLELKWLNKGAQPATWCEGFFMGFGTDYEIQESGNGIACGTISRVIVLAKSGHLLLVPFSDVLMEVQQ